jgi:predicted MFS family arabinose efflux permease
VLPIDKAPVMFSSFSDLAIGWLTMFVIGSDLFVVSPLLPLIAADYGIPPASTGSSVTVFSLTYMLGAPLFGHVADRIGRRRVVTCCLCVFAAANLLTAIAGNLAWLLAARSLAGASAAGISPSIYALIGGRAPADRRATWLAIVVSGLLMSLAFGAPIGLLAAVSLGWRIVFAGLGALSLLLAWANHRVWPGNHRSSNRTVPARRMTAPAVAARLAPTVIWSTAIYAMYTYLGEGLTSLGYSTEQIAEVILFYGCGAILGVLTGGRMTDRLGARLTSAIGLAGLCLCLLLLRVALDTGMLVKVAFAFSSLVAQLFFPAQQVWLANEFPDHRAAILAWNNSALFLGISLGSVVGALAVSFGGFDIDLLISAAVAIAGLTINLNCPWRSESSFTRICRCSLGKVGGRFGLWGGQRQNDGHRCPDPEFAIDLEGSTMQLDDRFRKRQP